MTPSNATQAKLYSWAYNLVLLVATLLWSLQSGQAIAAQCNLPLADIKFSSDLGYANSPEEALSSTCKTFGGSMHYVDGSKFTLATPTKEAPYPTVWGICYHPPTEPGDPMCSPNIRQNCGAADGSSTTLVRTKASPFCADKLNGPLTCGGGDGYYRCPLDSPSDKPPPCDSSNPTAGNPVYIGMAAKLQRESDIAGSATHIGFTRFYSSRLPTGFGRNHGYPFSAGWRHTYSRHILKVGFAEQSDYLVAVRPEGLHTFFTDGLNQWKTDPDTLDRLEELKDAGGIHTGWLYTVEQNGEVETYNVNGKLLSITNRAGLTQTLAHDA
ncbi:MAG: hypothetical protein Q8O37_11055, partial [Sulfuricellaceae bacterium]|nr:hypothetical protein [Sulfuricellaceae bacterium]